MIRSPTNEAASSAAERITGRSIVCPVHGSVPVRNTIREFRKCRMALLPIRERSCIMTVYRPPARLSDRDPQGLPDDGCP